MTKDKQTRIWTDGQKDKWTDDQTDVLKGQKDKRKTRTIYEDRED